MGTRREILGHGVAFGGSDRLSTGSLVQFDWADRTSCPSSLMLGFLCAFLSLVGELDLESILPFFPVFPQWPDGALAVLGGV